VKLSEEQASALVRQGDEAVVAFLVKVTARLAALEEQVARNSGNGSSPALW